MKLQKIALVLTVLAASVACTTENSDDLSTTQTLEDAIASGSNSRNYETVETNLEVKDYTDNVISDATERGMDYSSSSNMRTSGEGGEEGKQKRPKQQGAKRFHVRDYIDCADVTTTEDGDTKTVVIDFSSGACESKDGSVVGGSVTEVHTVTETSIAHSTTFADFSENGKVKNGTTSVSGNVTFEEETEEGKKARIASGDLAKSVNLTIDFPATDSTEAYTETIVRSIDEEILDGTKTVTGSMSVTSTVDGESFSTEITEALVYNPQCGEEKPVFAPISGVEVMTKGDETITVDYGDGECDFEVTVTLTDGTSEVVDLKDAYDVYGFVGVSKGRKAKKGSKGSK
ncbi:MULTISPECIES: hypothetical protein [Flammeovirga]|uniref:Lipoprotein n=1 Tax=Flammeovirga agarivorans TaxID=2726742 RepID=A0A7X8SG32_9BACT|nr:MULTISPECIES: hypothetical protein [Flammeovirga]NLR89604.1 hypothetical protein [Flammeovirga agarivorans]